MFRQRAARLCNFSFFDYAGWTPEVYFGVPPAGLLLAVEHAHLGRIVASARNGLGRNGSFDSGKLIGGELDRESAQALGQLSPRARANHWDNEAALGQHPCDGQLRGRNAFAVGDLLEFCNQLLVTRQVVRR